MTTFKDLGLAETLLATLAGEGYERPTPIQAQAIPHLLAGRDLLGIAQTGTGKTAAFALPIIQRLAETRRRPAGRSARALVLSPTRELASQIADSFRAYGRDAGLGVTTVFGGVGHRPQTQALRRGVDVLVATPGRLIDHIESGNLDLGQTEIFVLDEADQMLDMGFIHAIRKIVPMLPAARQSLFFSATMPREMAALADKLLDRPEQVAVAPVATTVERVDQRVIFVEAADKGARLAAVLRAEGAERTLVFTRTKRGADRVARNLARDGLAAEAIHGNKSQSQRERALAAFRNGRAPILVATDIAARGIDVDAVTHVVNFDLPNVPESYVHRIGRTARAGASGIAISLCSRDERSCLRDIEKLTRQHIPVDGAPTQPAQADDGAAHAAAGPAASDRQPARKRRRGGRGRAKAAGGDTKPAAAPRQESRQDRTREERPREERNGVEAVAFLRRPTRAPQAYRGA